MSRNCITQQTATSTVDSTASSAADPAMRVDPAVEDSILDVQRHEHPAERDVESAQTNTEVHSGLADEFEREADHDDGDEDDCYADNEDDFDGGADDADEDDADDEDEDDEDEDDEVEDDEDEDDDDEDYEDDENEFADDEDDHEDDDEDENDAEGDDENCSGAGPEARLLALEDRLQGLATAYDELDDRVRELEPDVFSEWGEENVIGRLQYDVHDHSTQLAELQRERERTALVTRVLTSVLTVLTSNSRGQAAHRAVARSMLVELARATSEDERRPEAA